MNLSFHNRSETLCVLLVIDADMHAENATPDCPQLQKQKRVSNDAIDVRYHHQHVVSQMREHEVVMIAAKELCN